MRTGDDAITIDNVIDSVGAVMTSSALVKCLELWNYGGGNILPPHKIQQPSFSYCRLWEINEYEFGPASHGIASRTNLMKIRTDAQFYMVIHVIRGTTDR
jgi:hypothetical protein